MLTRIAVDDLRVECLIGVRDPERITPQCVRVDLEVHVDGTHAATGDALAHTFCYDRVARDVAFLLDTGRFYLLETAGVAVVQGEAYGLSPYFRASFVAPEDDLHKGGRLIQEACAALQ